MLANKAEGLSLDLRVASQFSTDVVRARPCRRIVQQMSDGGTSILQFINRTDPINDHGINAPLRVRKTPDCDR